MSRISVLIRQHRLPIGAAGMLATAFLVFVLVWFQPQKLLIEKTVNEAAPSPTATTSAPKQKDLASGTFRSLEHKTTGTVRLIKLADGSTIVRIERLDTSNGPDVRVYLSSIPADRGMHDYGNAFIDLGALKGNRGNQNYRVPAGTDLSKYESVVIWCRRFVVGFAVAPLNAA